MTILVLFFNYLTMKTIAREMAKTNNFQGNVHGFAILAVISIPADVVLIVKLLG